MRVQCKEILTHFVSPFSHEAIKLSTAEKALIIGVSLLIGVYSYPAGIAAFYVISAALKYRHTRYIKIEPKEIVKEKEPLTFHIYNSPSHGTSQESYEALTKKITTLFRQQIADKKIFVETWDGKSISGWKKHDVVVFPGGETRHWVVTKEINDWWLQGGRLIGVCGGGYFLSEHSLYKTPIEEYRKDREIKVFSGTCSGPVSSVPSLIAITCQKTKQSIPVVLLGGGRFYPNRDSQNCEVLATYSDVEKSAAIVKCTNNSGGVGILMGPHLEFKSSDFAPLLNSLYPPTFKGIMIESTLIRTLHDGLLAQEQARQDLLDDLFRQLTV